MATDLDELQIVITSNSNEASEALDKLVKGLENLNTALGNLDASKVNSFANSMSKIANIGANTDTTGKAIKGLAKNLADSFGIKTKKGIDDITVSMLALYRASRNVNLNDSMENNNVFENSIDNLKKAIEANFQYRQSVDETNKKIADFVKAQNKSGNKIAMGEMAEELGEDFKAVSKILGSSFKNKLKDNEAAPLAEFLTEMNEVLNTDFKTDTLAGQLESIERIKNAILDSKDVVYDYGQAISKGLLSGEEAGKAAYEVVDKLFALIKEQDKYGASAGLSGLVSAMNAISNANIPDMSGFADAVKNIQSSGGSLSNVSSSIENVAKSVEDIGTKASGATEQVQELEYAFKNITSQIWGNEIVDTGFLMKDVEQFKNVEFPPALITQTEVFQEKLLPAIIDTENEIGNLYQEMMNISGVETAYDAITQKFIDWKMQLMDLKGAISGDKWVIPEFTGNADFSRMQTGWISDIKPEVVEGYFYEIEDAANKCLPAIVNVGTTAMVTADSFKQIEEATRGLSNQESEKVFDGVATEAEKAASSIEDAVEAMRRYKKIISEMETGKTPFDKSAYDEAIQGYHAAAEAVKVYKNALLGLEKTSKADTPKEIVPQEGLANVSEHFKSISEGFENLSRNFDALGDKGVSLFKKLITPIKMVSAEYIEKFEGMSKTVENFQKDFQTRMKKVSDFWKRTMRTFTFMIVRKVFTAVLKEIGTAVQSLAMYSSAMGTAFNTDISNMVADFQYLGKSIVSVFAPLLSYVAPIVDAIVDKIATLLSYIGMLIAALGGASSFTKAKKNVTDYAKSLDKAGKSAKNLTMGIDELNILNDSSGGSSKPFDGWEDAWEDVKIPDWIKDLADKIKGIFKDLFEPIKKAWNLAEKYVIDGWKYMTEQMKKLLTDVWRDFIRVWKSDTVVHIFYNLFMIIGDLERVIGNIAKRLDEAWNEGEKGYQIFKNIAEIVDILVQHIRNVTFYMVEWSDDLDFNPLLESIVNLTKSFKDLADFLGGVFEDIMRNIVLKYIQFLIEEGIPHLNNTISEIIDAFDFSDLREKLQPVEEAFEHFLEAFDIGKTNAIGNLGKILADFTKSEDFNNFLNTIEHIMNSIDAETIENILTGIGIGISRVAESIVKFVGSDLFNAFIDKITDWINNVSPEDIADGLEKIAHAILIFKFVAFASEGLSGFFSFLSVLKASKDLSTISKILSETAGGVSGIGVAIRKIGGVGLVISGIITTVSSFFKMWNEGWSGAREILKDVGIALTAIGAVMLGVAAAPAAIVAAIVAVLSTLVIVIHDHWEEICAFFTETIPSWWEGTALPWLSSIPSAIAQFFATIWETITTWIGDLASSIAEKVSEVINSVATFFGELPGKIAHALGFVIGTFASWLNSIIQWTVTNIPLIIHNIVSFFIELPGKIYEWLKNTLVKFGEWASSVYNWIQTNVPLFIYHIINFFMELPGKIANVFAKVISKFIEWASDIINWITTNIPQIVSDFMSFFEEIPQKLWDLGVDIISGLIDGVKNAWNTLKGGISDFCSNFIQGMKDGFKINSPSKETENVGEYVLEGLLLPFEEDQKSLIKSFTDNFINAFKTELSPDKFTAIGKQVIAGILKPITESTGSIATIMSSIFVAINTGLNSIMQTIGATIKTNLADMVKTCIAPFFSTAIWNPLLNGLLNGVFKPFISLFKAWFIKDVMNVWWKNDLLMWFTPSKWNDEIFTPLSALLKTRWSVFTTWWNTSMVSWWENHVIKWLGGERWSELLENIHKVAEKVFKDIVKCIDTSMETAMASVENACKSMKEYFTEMLKAIDEMVEALDKLESAKNTNPLTPGKPGQYATGGFPTEGTLFFAGEKGAEFVSNVNGRTGVVSNSEITGIADAVYATGNTESALLSQLIAVAQALLNKDPVILGDKDLAMAVSRGKSQMGMSIIT